MIEISSLVLFSDDPGRTAAFYRALGVPLDDEDHGEGPVHQAAEVGGIHFAIYAADPARAASPAKGPASGPAADWRQPGSSFPGFYVTSLEDTLAALDAAGAPVIARHEERPWGCRAIATDPDGRPVEINQRGHCPVATNVP